jgi:chemotaxis protein CheC
MPLAAPSDDEVVLFAHINFAISGTGVRGYLAMVLDFPSLTGLKALIAAFIARVINDNV